MKWFDPHVPAEDVFLPPKFDLGQFFFSRQTAVSLVDNLDHYSAPCCLCTPRLGWEWLNRGREVRVLDCDDRFASMPGFRQFDIMRPTPIQDSFDLLIVDPIFVPANVVRRAVDLVLHGSEPGAALYIVFPKDRASELLRTFASYQLGALEFELKHNNVKSEAHHQFGLFGNRPLQEGGIKR